MFSPSLFEDQRLTLDRAIALTAESLNEYGKQYDHWTISFSGGKDSTATVTVIADLIHKGLIKRPKSLTVLYADTRQELPPLHLSALQVLQQMRDRGYQTQIVQPELDKRFLVYILGRGVPPPNNSTMRWCTEKLKMMPMKSAMQSIFNAMGERMLSINGVRVGESAARDQRIAVSCSKNGSECGQGWFQRDLPEKLCDKLAPILHWRVCHVWDWLFFHAPELGFDTQLLAEAYGGEEAQELNARTGCIGCPLASDPNKTLRVICQMPQWQYLTPLLELADIYREMRKFKYRLQKDGSERNKDGSLSSNPGRKGPLTLEARQFFLEQILNIQNQVNHTAINTERPIFSLISEAEETRIRELIAANTWPEKWNGTEPKGDAWLPDLHPDGSAQLLLFDGNFLINKC